MKRILVANDDLSLFASTGGGKAKHLAKLVQLGFNVPEFFCISSDVFREFLRHNGIQTDFNESDDFKSLAARIEAVVIDGNIPPDAVRDIETQLGAMGLGDTFVAVRSSGLDEDSAQNSFAGQFSSFLFRKGISDVIDALKRCWASAFSERALHYRKERGLTLRDIDVAVVVQKMVNADSAGVAFSRNPMRPLDRESIVVSSVWGLGEGLVSGELDADHFEVGRTTWLAKMSIAVKDFAIRRGPRGGIEKVAVVDSYKAKPSLTEAQVINVAKIALKLEESFGSPQDCEWAFENGVCFLVQTRPITTLPKNEYFSPAIGGVAPILWDNSNIIESYCGVTSPLTFSLVSRAYAQVYRQFAEVMGVPQSTIDAHVPMFRNMLGLIRGRVYYNLVNWYRLVMMFPGAANNKAFMETMMGVKQGLKPEIQRVFDEQLVPPSYSFWHTFSVTVLTLYRTLVVRKIIDNFTADFGEVYEAARKLDLSTKSLPELVSHAKFIETRLVTQWKAPIINDTRCMIFFGTLKKLTETWIGGDDAGTLQNDLLCGQGELESTEPTKCLMRLASAIDQGDSAFRTWFTETPAKVAWYELK